MLGVSGQGRLLNPKVTFILTTLKPRYLKPDFDISGNKFIHSGIPFLTQSV